MKKNAFRSIAVGLLAATMTVGTLPLANAAAQYDSIVLNIGADDTKRNVVWYSDSTNAQVVSLAVKGDEASAREIAPVKSGAAAKAGFTYHHATMDGLKPDTTYVYKVGSEADGWSQSYEFTTAPTQNFQVLAFGDPQMGSGGGIGGDDVAWQNTLAAAEAKHPGYDYLLTVGDQVNKADSELEYSQFLSPDQLRTSPIATNIGNHDDSAVNYGQHFFMPNTSTTAGTERDYAGIGNYWYEFNDTLFLNFNSNNRDDAAHFEWAKQVIAEHGEGTNWQVATMHHGPYSTASHTHDSDIIQRRANWPVAMSDLGVDLVIGGHDHIYSRSHLLNDGHPVGDLSAPATLAQADEEVLWITMNSSTGSKYYTEQFWKNGDPFPFNAVSDQDRKPSYSTLNISPEALQIVTQDVDGRQIDDVTITRTDVANPRPEGDVETDFRVAHAGEKPQPNKVGDDGVTRVEGRILQGWDDIEEEVDGGKVDLESSDLELIRDGDEDQIVAMRFDALQIPAKAQIQSAYIQFTVDEPKKSTDTASLSIQVENTGHSEKYADEAGVVSARTYLDQKVAWEPKPWPEAQVAGEDQRTPDLSNLVQAIVDGEGWVRGNAMAFIVTGTGVRTAEAYEGGESEEAPKLMVEYTTPGVTEILAPIAKAEDDLEEAVADKKLDPGSSDLELGYEKNKKQIVGLRYDLDIPAGAKIQEAYVQFTTDEPDKSVNPFSVDIRAALEDNVAAFGTVDGALSGYGRTDASVTWEAPVWELEQEQRRQQRTPNIAPVIQEIVDRDGWTAGNGLALLLEGEGARSAESYEGGGAEEAPILWLRYTMGTDDDGSDDEPGKPNPDKPADPKPGKPADPKPGKPGNSGKPGKPADPKPGLPRTGR